MKLIPSYFLFKTFVDYILKNPSDEYAKFTFRAPASYGEVGN